jgi:hypothetical protein
MDPMTTYNVTARRWDRGWELSVAGVGVTQARRLGAEAERMVLDYIELDRGRSAVKGARLVFTYDVGDAGAEATAARAEVEAAERHQREASARYRQAALRLIQSGLSQADAARVMDVSPQRFGQLIPEQTAARTARRRSG